MTYAHMSPEDSKKLTSLYREYVTAKGEVDIDRLCRCLKDEIVIAKAVGVSVGMWRKLRRDQKEAGRIRNIAAKAAQP